jgi:hypothetical protein
MHEYAAKEISTKTFTEARGLIKSLFRLFAHDDTVIPRIVIRSLKQFANNNGSFLNIYYEASFQDALIRSGIITKVLPLMNRGGEDGSETQYWTIVIFKPTKNRPFFIFC